MSALIYKGQEVYQIELKRSYEQGALGYPWLGFKAIRSGNGKEYFVALIVPGDARVLSTPSGSEKIRVDMAHVLAIMDRLGNEVKSVWHKPWFNGEDLRYKVGTIVRPVRGWDGSGIQCAGGIHCFSSIADLWYLGPQRLVPPTVPVWERVLGLEGLW